MLSTLVLSSENHPFVRKEAPTSTGGGGCHDKDRVAQLIVTPVLFPEIMITDELSDTERGSGGFGSTGVK